MRAHSISYTRPKVKLDVEQRKCVTSKEVMYACTHLDTYFGAENLIST